MAEHQDVVLVYLPMSQVNFPAMALSLFKALLKNQGISSVVDYANMYFYQQIGKEKYTIITGSHCATMLGECVFQPAAFPGKSIDWDGYYQYILANPPIAESRYLQKEELLECQQAAIDFIEETAERIMSFSPKIVAIGTMFQQNNALFALVKALRRRSSELVILVGGCNCYDTAGRALIKSFPEINYIFQGEADEIMADFCQSLLGGEKPHGRQLPYGIIDKYSDLDLPVHRLTKDLDKLPYPDYDDYLSTQKQLNLVFPGNPALYIEGSRGCWWGQKHQCTFCGLNGCGIVYRQKSTQRLVAEMKYLLERYGIKYVFFTDSILSYQHMKELPRAMVEAQVPSAKYFTEIKSAATLEEIRALAKVGFCYFQPGIESLNDHVLALMHKGCRAIKQIETMKNYRRCRVWFTWNLLCGFPGEKNEDYEAMVEILPLISHLEAPKAFFNIAYHKSSIYERNRDEYGLQLEPLHTYQYVYSLGQDFINDVAYVYQQVDAEARYLEEDVARRGPAYAKLADMVRKWEESVVNPDRLDMSCRPDGTIEIMDFRPCSTKMFHTLQGLTAEVYRQTEQVIEGSKLLGKLQNMGYEAEDIAKSIEALLSDRLLLQIGREYLALAIEEED